MAHAHRALARRYAKALFELAAQKDNLKKVEKDLGGLAALLSTSDDLKEAIGHPILSRQNQTDFMLALLNRAKAEELTKNFIAVVANNRRLAVLPAIIEAFNEKLRIHNNEIIAEVTTAIPLKASQNKEIEQKLGKALNKTVKVKNITDEKILGGLKIKIGSRMLDNSLSGKIEKLAWLSKQAIVNR